MTPTEHIFKDEGQVEANQQLPWPPARESTFQSPDDPALIIDESKRDLLKELAGNYHYE